MAYSLRDIIKQRTRELSSTDRIYPTIYKYKEEDEWIESNDIIHIGRGEVNIRAPRTFNGSTGLDPNYYIKQVGSNVTEVHHILVEDGIIPPNIFKYAVNVTDFSHCFEVKGGDQINKEKYSEHLRIKSIPRGLFDRCFKVTNFNWVFAYQFQLSSIPEGLFANNRNVESFIGSFEACKELKEVPENLFASNTMVTNFANCFESCENLLSLPEGLFANNVNVTSFNYCFNQCYGLMTIPKNLFANNTEVDSFRCCFSSCKSLKAVPGNLFDTNQKATNFECCFAHCESLTNIPLNIFDNFDLIKLSKRMVFTNDKNTQNFKEFVKKYNLRVDFFGAVN